jgi:ABC-type nitrate/sulfonate/bicarbonate transport system ATPase subunit
MVKLTSIFKRYGDKLVLADLSLEAGRGEIVCLCGPSGCGKTTILEIIAGALRPDSGQRLVGTTSIGYAFQDDCLIPWKTVEENMWFALSSRLSSAQAKEKTAAWLKTMRLEEAASKKPTELSGGMKRRLNLARSFAIQPELLLLDEPFAFQDNEQIGTIKRQITQAMGSPGTTIILAAHDFNQVSDLSCRLLEFSSQKGHFAASLPGR